MTSESDLYKCLANVYKEALNGLIDFISDVANHSAQLKNLDEIIEDISPFCPDPDPKPAPKPESSILRMLNANSRKLNTLNKNMDALIERVEAISKYLSVNPEYENRRIAVGGVFGEPKNDQPAS